MRVVTWAIRFVVFVLLAAFGARNVEPVTLRFYFDLAIQTPLIVALFGAFALGALFGILSLLGRVLRQRREISVLRKKTITPDRTPVPPASTPASPPSLPPTVPPL